MDSSLDLDAGPIDVYQVFHFDDAGSKRLRLRRVRRRFSTLRSALFARDGARAVTRDLIPDTPGPSASGEGVLVRMRVPEQRLSLITDGDEYVVVDTLALPSLDWRGCREAFAAGERQRLDDVA